MKQALNEESRFTGAINLYSYWQYFRAGADCFCLASFATTFLIAQFFFIATDYWLTLWTNAEELGHRSQNSVQNDQVHDFKTSQVDIVNSTYETTASEWSQNIDTATGVYFYSILIASLFFFTVIATIQFFLICTSASVKLHNNMFDSIIRAKLNFFDQNPVGNDWFTN